MLGTKVKRLRTAGSYTVEELFDAIKEVRFTAGRPRLTHLGLTPLIVFPALDIENQVRVCNVSLRSRSNRFSVQRGECVGSVVEEAVLDDLADGWLGMGFSLGNAARLCEQLAERTYEELGRLGL